MSSSTASTLCLHLLCGALYSSLSMVGNPRKVDNALDSFAPHMEIFNNIRRAIREDLEIAHIMAHIQVLVLVLEQQLMALFYLIIASIFRLRHYSCTV